ncbi:prepilin-type N-terminal cleavage/methylation domain-containing protein [Candidatus Berkiella cookevillensis]|uniref:Prepilin-type N-terminal cleavage/methylation domain-containing protein n=1 Tax=Candidatus Berkiella cookevillensis TaxID=437022 RepID=A0A0Q9YE28_9GAMM|nr:prepilin-type N-terminal cleavage/methylation domain-containing protein [Candidatus Berkiella cookevillensis]MCS5709652.1 prepilin-type N-terminal cleavage/methylation domain-containing protein [Candidatus Berkiella cookevillensis]
MKANNVFPKSVHGFTLIEMLLALIVLAITMKVFILLSLSFSNAFTAVRQNHMTYSILSHASDFLSAELSSAYPYSMAINADKSSIRYRKILYHGGAYLQKVEQGWAVKIPESLNIEGQALKAMAAIAVASHPTIILDVQMNNQAHNLILSFELSRNDKNELNHSNWAVIYMLSPEYSIDFSRETQTLVRKLIREDLDNGEPALISHLTDCKFNWYKGYKTLNINLVQRIDTENDYTFVQQIIFQE